MDSTENTSSFNVGDVLCKNVVGSQFIVICDLVPVGRKASDVFYLRIDYSSECVRGRTSAMTVSAVVKDVYE